MSVPIMRGHSLHFSVFLIDFFFKVFRVLCGEWVEPLWDCMFLADPSTCIPFFLLITFVANFMVFNLFVAILLEAFNVENLNEGKAAENKISEKKSATIKRGIEKISVMIKDKKKNLRNSFRKSKDLDKPIVNTSNGGHQLVPDQNNHEVRIFLTPRLSNWTRESNRL